MRRTSIKRTSPSNALLVALVMGCAVLLADVWSSAAALSTGMQAGRGSIAVVGAGLPAARGIYRRYPNGDLQQLTTNGEHAPVWSRDGRRIAFLRFDVGQGPFVCSLFVMNSDGSNVLQVGQVKTDCSGVSWGLGDRRIVFGGGDWRNPGLWIVNVDGSGLRRLLAGRGADEGIHPAWSPDGRTIVFGWSGRSRHPWGRLAAIRPDGRGFRVLVRPRSAPYEDDVSLPAWSRDGKRLAFVRVDHRSGHASRRIEVADARGEHRQTLVRLPYGSAGSKWSGTPTWSPNGRSIAFSSDCGRGSCVSTVSSQGGRRQVLLRNYMEPAWGPAGS